MQREDTDHVWTWRGRFESLGKSEASSNKAPWPKPMGVEEYTQSPPPRRGPQRSLRTVQKPKASACTSASYRDEKSPSRPTNTQRNAHGTNQQYQTYHR